MTRHNYVTMDIEFGMACSCSICLYGAYNIVQCMVHKTLKAESAESVAVYAIEQKRIIIMHQRV